MGRPPTTWSRTLLDHLKCTRMVAPHPAASNLDDEAQRWEALYGEGIEFVQRRRCRHPHGMVAHGLNRRSGQLYSVFIVPRAVQESGILEIMGERVSAWMRGTQTVVVVSTAGEKDFESFLQFARRAGVSPASSIGWGGPTGSGGARGCAELRRMRNAS